LISKEVLAMPFTPHKMISLNIDTLDAKAASQAIASLLAPRPPAWVSTRGADGTTNLAPFAYFSGVSARPPIFMLSIGQRDDHPKDTLRNILETREYVINFADQNLAKAVDTTARELPYGVNEAALAGVTLTESARVVAPRVAEAVASLELRLLKTVPLEGSQYTLVLGQMIYLHVRADLWNESGLLDAHQIDPLLRLAGGQYGGLGAVYRV
jgi:flavin reductase (DIM6/NTAB) family NADH-FMN oxidoreductase RutF